MKPAKFEYLVPDDVEGVLDLLRTHSHDAKVLAGGQSLMPLLNMRLARPKVLVDINRIAGLDYILETNGGIISIGALTRQRLIEKSPLVRDNLPVLSTALASVGHVQIRNRGTIGGSISHADPAAEISALCLALEAEFVLKSHSSERIIDPESFFLGQLTTALEPEELLTEIRLPSLSDGWGWGFQEVCRRRGDFALVGCVALIRLDDRGMCQDARISMFGAGETPVRMREAETRMFGSPVDSSALDDVARLVSEKLDPVSDIHASAAYRKQVGGAIARRSLEAATNQGKGA